MPKEPSITFLTAFCSYLHKPSFPLFSRGLHEFRLYGILFLDDEAIVHAVLIAVTVQDERGGVTKTLIAIRRLKPQRALSYAPQDVGVTKTFIAIKRLMSQKNRAIVRARQGNKDSHRD